MRRILPIVVLFFMISVPFAAGHPFTDETIPPQFSNAPIGTSQVIVIYSESIEINHSVLEVFDSNGEQVDNKDTRYYQGDSSLVVTTPPLEQGAYTVTSKVLSRVDGHLVPSAFVFGVGDVKIEAPMEGRSSIIDLIFFPEAGARFPGLVGQTIALGAVIASMFVWGTQRKDIIADMTGIEKFFHSKFMSLVGFGLIIVFASNILMLTVQTLRLETSALDALQTSFGMTWIIRMAVTIALLAVWFWMERMKKISFKNQIPLLILTLILIGTTTMMGHGMASGQAPAVVLDYIHNLVAAIWIGGIIFFAFTLLPSFGRLDENIREKMSLAAIPRFSIMIVIALGVVIITGPILMWLLESDVHMITESTYGKLIILKILLASAMIGIGGYHQFGIQKKAEKNIKSGKISVNKRLKRALKAEAALGIVLLLVVALLTNGTLPEGEIRTAQAREVTYGFSTLEFGEELKFNIEIFPFTTGTNSIKVEATDFSGEPVSDLEAVKVKISNPLRNISPIIIPMESINQVNTKFQGEATFGFSGYWQIEVEAQRTQGANEGRDMSLLIKPRLDDLKAEIIEYELPEAGAPLYPEFDGSGNIWITDSAEPRLWRFSIEDGEFAKYEFDGQASIALKIDNSGKIWFTDIPEGRIGFIDPVSGQSNIVEFPDIIPVIDRNYPITLDVDRNNGIWTTIANKNVLVRYDQDTKEFDVYKLPTKDSGPFAVAIDESERVWFTQQTAGQIGFLEPESGQIKEFMPETPLATPETITFDADGNLWIAEHQEGGGITKYNPFLDSFERIKAPDSTAFPNSVVFDRYENAWFALHTVDKIAAYDPHRENMIEVPIPTAESWVQFTTSDDKDNIWFVEQKPAKLSMLKLTETPVMEAITENPIEFNLEYTEIASPLIALGIIATSLFFVKSIKDKRRINSLIE